MGTEISRRKFLGTSAAAAVVAGTMGKGQVFGANDRVRVCIIGLHGQGNSHRKDLILTEGMEVVALCDVDRDVLQERAGEHEAETGKKPTLYRNIQDALADDGIDAVTIATPNHWHTLAAIWACQAGKDVYVEKPLSHSIWEGRQLAAAAKKYNRVVQHGTQSRSKAKLMRDIKLMHNGIIGKVHMARGFTYKNGNRHSIGHKPSGLPPDNLDWNLWQGPAEEREYCANYVHYDWHWFWHYGNGEIGNQGVHQMDAARWGLNQGLPVKAYSVGSRIAWDDQGETPNTHVTTFTYADGSILEFEVRNLGSYQEAGQTTGNTFFGSDGYYVASAEDHVGGGFNTYQREPIPVDEPYPETSGRFGNFLKAIHSRKKEDIRGTAEEGHLSCVHCHIANIAYRLGRELHFDPEKERFVGDKQANKMLKRRPYRKGFEVPQLA